MWIVSINCDKTTLTQKKNLDRIYGSDYFPRKFHYKKEADYCRQEAEIVAEATLKVEKE